MTNQEMIAVIQAHAEGKPIQFLDKEYPAGGWQPAGVPCWDFDSYEYRVKPEPETIWIVTFSDGSKLAKNTEAEAIGVQSVYAEMGKLVPSRTKYVEAL